MRYLAAIAFVTATAGGAYADCVPKPSTADSFGVAHIGSMQDVRMARLAKRDAGCVYSVDQSCGYTDTNGVTYSVVEDFLEAKTITLATLKPSVPLPFGLSRTETIASVRAKVSPQIPVPFIAATNFLSTDVCLRDPVAGGVFDLWFDFDDQGRLSSMGTRVPGVRD
ncbi:MAG TPA: hypothetical protein VHZ78_02760 [Rhizomicrobium sp.]|jgi:hypothetical protein|nr:hypothetical protein [Rhizomicrobium sp.]